MFGFYRFILAFFVILYHLGGYHPIGWYSVYGFFVLSGYLMTLVISKKYPLNSGGLVSFEFNRVLRIFPAYLLIMLAAMALMAIPSFAAVAADVRPRMGMPTSLFDWWQNFFFYGWQTYTPKLMPHCWSIARELVICSLVFFIFARNRWLSLAWLFLCIGFAGFTLAKELPFFWVYHSHKTAMISYALGGCIYHFRGSLKNLTRPLLPLLLLASLLPFLNESLWRIVDDSGRNVSAFYVNTILSAYMVLLLSTLREAGKSWIVNLDNFLGNISYPMFLVHWNIGILVKSWMGGPMEPSFALFAVCLVPIMAISWVINTYVEQPLTPVRRKTFASAGEFFAPLLGLFKPSRASAPEPSLIAEFTAEPVPVPVEDREMVGTK